MHLVHIINLPREMKSAASCRVASRRRRDIRLRIEIALPVSSSTLDAITNLRIIHIASSSFILIVEERDENFYKITNNTNAFTSTCFPQDDDFYDGDGDTLSKFPRCVKFLNGTTSLCTAAIKMNTLIIVVTCTRVIGIIRPMECVIARFHNVTAVTNAKATFPLSGMENARRSRSHTRRDCV